MRSDAVKLTGTDEPPVTARLLRAGPLTVELENGQLRYLRHDGVELLRGIAFLARDQYWGTFAPALDEPDIIEMAERFSVRFTARCAPDAGDFRYGVEIVGEATGRLTVIARGAPQDDFTTNRTGFVVLHPLAGVAGAEVGLEHTNGRCETVTLPARISPHEPAQDLFAITHTAEGLAVRVEMTGDAYDMEDQRNWTDASFKTYIRPLSRPKPYVIAAGESVTQSVTVTVTGRHAAPADATAGDTVLGTMPEIGLATEASVMPYGHRFGWLSHLVCRPASPEEVGPMLALAADLGARPELQFAIPGVDPSAELADWAAAGEADSVLVTPWRLWPSAPADGHGDVPLEAIANAARAAFPTAKIGGGVLTGFTEFNRHRPPTAQVDYVRHATTAIVHAADDRSVMETLDALPHVFASARALAGGRTYRVGPATIGMALNPDGPPRQTTGGRSTMVRNDPRQRGLFAAAWLLGYVAKLLPAGVESFTPGFMAGELGLLEDDGRLRPVYHTVRAQARAAGQAVSCVPGLPHGSVGLAFAGSTIVANLSPHEVSLSLAGSGATLLDTRSFETAETDEGFFDRAQIDWAGATALGPYATARIWP